MSSRSATRTGQVVAAIVLLLSAWYSWSRANPFWGLDFAQLWTGGKSARQHGTAIYGERGQSISNAFISEAFTRQQSPRLLNVIRERESMARSASREWLAAFVSTPFLYFTFSLLPQDYEAAWLIYRLLSLAATIAACLLLCRLAGLTAAGGMMLAAAALVFYEPLASDQRIGNTNQLQLLALAVYLRLAADARLPFRIAGGLLLGLTIAFKPNVALVAVFLILYLLVRGAIRAALIDTAAIAGGGIAAIAIGSLWFGSFAAWTEWMAVAKRLAEAEVARATGNIAVLQSPAVVAILALVAVGAAVAMTRDEADDADRLRLVAAVGPVIYLLGAKVVWLHYPVLVLAPAVLLIGVRNPKHVRIAVAIALVLLAVMPLGFLIRWRDVAVQANLIFAGLVILAAATLYVTSRRRESPQPLRRRRS
jgi:hypothetical protein